VPECSPHDDHARHAPMAEYSSQTGVHAPCGGGAVGGTPVRGRRASVVMEGCWVSRGCRTVEVEVAVYVLVVPWGACRGCVWRGWRGWWLW
jgi:hypothetical protein